MPKQKVEVKKGLLQTAIKATEAAKTYTSQNAMFEDAATAYNANTGVTAITGSIARARCAEMEIKFKTPKGQRGNFSKAKKDAAK